MKIIRFTDHELDSLRFAVADKMLQLKKQVTQGEINNDEAADEIETLGKVAEKCNNLVMVPQVA